jgi:FSR family fosmidomycin resistance protein-like MFS transporter
MIPPEEGCMAKREIGHEAGGTSTRARFNVVPVLTLAAGHGTVDVYGSFLAPLLPLFALRFNLSLTLVGTLVSILTIADGLSQPLFGYWGDRMRRPWLVMIGPCWVAVTTGFLGLATGYAMLAFLLVLSGAGRSAFHPQGAAGIAEYAGGRRGLALSIFTSAGNLGFATGPILATALVTLTGLPGTLYAMPLGIVVTALLYTRVFKGHDARPATWSPPPLKEIIGNLARYRGGFVRLWLLVVLRSLTYFSLFSFLPIIFTQQGLSTLQTGMMTSFFLFGGAVGGIVGGWLADRLHERPIIAGSFAIAFPTLQLALMLPGAWGTAFLMLGGFCLLSSAPVTIGLAQRYAPGSAATASSLMLGVGWGTGGLLVTLVGMLADWLGPVSALRIQGLCLVIAVLLALTLPTVTKPRSKH